MFVQLLLFSSVQMHRSLWRLGRVGASVRLCSTKVARENNFMGILQYFFLVSNMISGVVDFVLNERKTVKSSPSTDILQVCISSLSIMVIIGVSEFLLPIECAGTSIHKCVVEIMFN